MSDDTKPSGENKKQAKQESKFWRIDRLWHHISFWAGEHKGFVALISCVIGVLGFCFGVYEKYSSRQIQREKAALEETSKSIEAFEIVSRYCQSISGTIDILSPNDGEKPIQPAENCILYDDKTERFSRIKRFNLNLVDIAALESICDVFADKNENPGPIHQSKFLYDHVFRIVDSKLSSSDPTEVAAALKINSYLLNKYNAGLVSGNDAYPCHDKYLGKMDFPTDGDFTGIRFDRTIFFESKFVNCDFSRCSLQQTDFSLAQFDNVDFEQTNSRILNIDDLAEKMPNTIFKEAIFRNCTNFRNANFINCNFQDAQFDTTTFSDGCMLSGSSFSNLKSFDNVTFEAVNTFPNQPASKSDFGRIYLSLNKEEQAPNRTARGVSIERGANLAGSTFENIKCEDWKFGLKQNEETGLATERIALNYSTFKEVEFSNSKLANVDLSGADWRSVTFDSIESTFIENCKMDWCRLKNPETEALDWIEKILDPEEDQNVQDLKFILESGVIFLVEKPETDLIVNCKRVIRLSDQKFDIHDSVEGNQIHTGLADALVKLGGNDTVKRKLFPSVDEEGRQQFPQEELDNARSVEVINRFFEDHWRLRFVANLSEN